VVPQESIPKYELTYNCRIMTINRLVQAGALESFLSSSCPRVFPLQYQNLDRFFSLSISEVFVCVCVGGGLLAVSGFRPTHLAGSDTIFLTARFTRFRAFSIALF
jgi:hypothetical protein